MELVLYTGTAYCNRCDRGFTAVSQVSQEYADNAAIELLMAHVVKHPDYVPTLHAEIDD